jgi:hypothetical protein
MASSRLPRRNDNGFRIGDIVLLALHEGTQVLRRDQLDLMALRNQFARPMMGAATYLYDDHSGPITSHEPQKLAARQLVAKYYLAHHRCAVAIR